MKTAAIQTKIHSICTKSLTLENLQHEGTSGVSRNNRKLGYVPAFLDTDSGHVYQSRYSNGKPASVHLLFGLPGQLFKKGEPSRQQRPVKKSVISGFLLEENFYTRGQAAEILKHIN